MHVIVMTHVAQVFVQNNKIVKRAIYGSSFCYIKKYFQIPTKLLFDVLNEGISSDTISLKH